MHDALGTERIAAVGEAAYVGHVERRTQTRKLDHVLHDRRSPLHRVQTAGEDEMIAAHDDSDAEESSDFLQVSIGHPGQREGVCSLRIESMLYDRFAVGQSLSWKASAFLVSLRDGDTQRF